MRLFMIGIVVLTLTGCGGSKSGEATVGIPTRGVATVDGKPASGAVLLFHGSGTGMPPRAMVSSDGKFELPSVGGLTEGQYVVTVEWRTGSDEDGDVRKSIVPDKYTRKELSPLKATVKAEPDGQCDLGTFAITK